MKNFNYLLLIFFLVLSARAEAQDKFSLGVSITPELTGQTDAIFATLKTKPALGYTAGIQADILTLKNLGFFVGLNYFQKNVKYGQKNVRVDDEDDPVFMELRDNNYYYK